MPTTEHPPAGSDKPITFYPDHESAQPTKPHERVTISPPILQEDSIPQNTTDIFIKAQPTNLGDECRFMVNQPLLAGHSWWFDNENTENNSGFADAIFNLGAIEKILVHNATLTVTKMYNDERTWQTLGEQIGQLIRNHLHSGKPLLPTVITENFPSTVNLETDILELIDTHINPGVAAHEGECTLEKVEGNTVYIRMGGGCQGCSSAGATLKYGIETVFRDNIPYLGAVFDDTDHAAGTNPYFQ